VRELIVVQMAIRDDLTRIANRRGFVPMAQKSLNICARRKWPAAMAFFDLNGFKAINDTFGHGEGDKALIAFADRMKTTFRDSDVVARLSGDEFVALLTHSTLAQAEEIVARLRLSLAAYNREAKRGYDITFSDGIVAVDHEEGLTVEQLLSNADKLMYKNKQA
jgi:diguanylate cyclase (GGDEF)-like protein